MKFIYCIHETGKILWKTIPYALQIANHILTSTRNHKRKCETNRPSAYHITPKRGNVGNPSSCFYYRHLTPDGVMGVFLPSLWKIRPFPNNYELWIMNFALFMTRTSVRLYERVGFTRCMDFPNNYELCITHYELFWASTRVRPYSQIQFLRCISQQLRIMNYELRIKMHLVVGKTKKDAIARVFLSLRY